ncbi:MAG: DNA/pantothenate metabolism flavoprotein domain protein [Verrucomicrobiae bacterium]|nr:DNA/pantothenate metabolism flavoprotein domain protein [Verrucomicrobiae bacterium]
MKFIVTCGPSYEPIDEVRLITNFSTSQLGTELTNFLRAKGDDVICLKGLGSTYFGNNAATQLISFSTSDNLASQLQRIAKDSEINAVFHAAGVSDYQVVGVYSSAGNSIATKKITTSEEEIIMHLKPTTKIIRSLREWFPKAVLVGWKYEVEGDQQSALAKGREQILTASTDACVVNGPLFGSGFALCQKDKDPAFFSERPDLFEELYRLV